MRNVDRFTFYLFITYPGSKKFPINATEFSRYIYNSSNMVFRTKLSQKQGVPSKEIDVHLKSNNLFHKT